MSNDFEKEIDELFTLPLTEFIQARNSLAARLRQNKRIEESGRVKALPKPSVSAWAVNQLYWKYRDAFQELMSAGQRFRTAQSTQLGGKTTDVRSPRDERSKTISSLSRLAATLLRDTGHIASPETVRRIATTLEALSAYESIPGGSAPGRLTADVDPPGFDALAALVQNAKPVSRSTEPRIASTRMPQRPGPEGIADAKAALKNAERELEEAHAKARDLGKALKQARAEAKESEALLQKAKAAADEALQNERRITVEAEHAARTLDSAVRAVDQASNDLQSLLKNSSATNNQKA